jgi:hypothetical protein
MGEGEVPRGDGARPRGSSGAGFAALNDDQRAQFRLRIFDGMIRALEARMK